MLDIATLSSYRNLGDWLVARCRQQPCPIIGLSGAQGTGKSTAAAFVAGELARDHGLRTVVLSLDDFYLPRAVRQTLAATVHPLLATRGVPGTHDVNLGIDCLQALRTLDAGDTLAVPRFSKADDDRLPVARWPRIEGPVDLILFEGWCLGLPPQAEDELIEPVNALEAQHDADGRWRRGVNAELAGAYADWFALLDALVVLQAPDFDCVRRWRAQQEADTARLAARNAVGVQSRLQLDRFMQFYERLTLHALRVLPAKAEVLLALDAQHVVRRMVLRGT